MPRVVTHLVAIVAPVRLVILVIRIASARTSTSAVRAINADLALTVSTCLEADIPAAAPKAHYPTRIPQCTACLLLAAPPTSSVPATPSVMRQSVAFARNPILATIADIPVRLVTAAAMLNACWQMDRHSVFAHRGIREMLPYQEVAVISTSVALIHARLMPFAATPPADICASAQEAPREMRIKKAAPQQRLWAAPILIRAPWAKAVFKTHLQAPVFAYVARAMSVIRRVASVRILMSVQHNVQSLHVV